MKKTLFAVALSIVLMLTATSAFNDARFGINPGQQAPVSALIGNDAHTDASQFILLTFWASDDASSRQRCKNNDTWVKNHATNIKHIAVNLDTQPTLINHIAAADGIKNTTMTHADAKLARQIRADYDLRDGYGSLLISPDKRVVAVNPSPSVLDANVR